MGEILPTVGGLLFCLFIILLIVGIIFMFLGNHLIGYWLCVIGIVSIIIITRIAKWDTERK